MKRWLFYIALFVIVISIGNCSAFSVSTLYSDNYPLVMNPGETKDTFFLLGNIVPGDDDVVVQSELTGGLDIAEITGGAKIYDVPFGSNVEVPVRVEIPKDAEIGTRYKVSAIFRPTPDDSNSGNIQFLVNIGKSFPVVVGEGRDDLIEQGAGGRIIKLTIEDENEELISGSTPESIGRTVWWVIILVLVFGFIITGVLIVYLIAKNRNRGRAMVMQPVLPIPQDFQPNDQTGDGNFYFNQGNT